MNINYLQCCVLKKLSPQLLSGGVSLMYFPQLQRQKDPAGFQSHAATSAPVSFRNIPIHLAISLSTLNSARPLGLLRFLLLCHSRHCLETALCSAGAMNPFSYSSLSCPAFCPMSENCHLVHISDSVFIFDN